MFHSACQTLKEWLQGEMKLPGICVLNQNTDFKRVYYRGKNQCHPALISYVLKNRAGCLRIGITASKKTGGAVKRNRARRIIKEAFRHLAPELRQNAGYDVVFVARAKTSRMKMWDVLEVMRMHMDKAGLLARNVGNREIK